MISKYGRLIAANLFTAGVLATAPITVPAVAAQGADGTTVGDFWAEPPTFISMGFEWRIQGDENHNASVEVSYRKKGEQQWRKGMPLVRSQHEYIGPSGPERPDFHPDPMDYHVPNMFAGSILDLEPDTPYEARFVLSDPDGVRGESTHTVTVATRPEPMPYSGGRVFHVYPHGFQGQKQEPSFEGLMCAYNYTCAGTDWATAGRPRVRPGDTILVHAAAGGVGLIMCQWAKHLGATVIGTVGSDEKAALARAHGCDHPIVYTRENFAQRVKEITGGKGLPRDVFLALLAGGPSLGRVPVERRKPGEAGAVRGARSWIGVIQAEAII